MVTLEGFDGPVEAQVTDGWWYIFQDGRAALPSILKVVGLDAAGAEVFTGPS